MAIGFDFGMHVISDAWMNTDTDPTTNAPGHAGTTAMGMLLLAARTGATEVRIPLSLSEIGANNPAEWAYLVNDTAALLHAAALRGVKVILEPGQTPADLRPVGSTNPDDLPDTPAKLAELAQRFASFAAALYSQHPQDAAAIAAWEVGNEPNLSYAYNGLTYGEEGDPTAPRYYVVQLDNAQTYAEYLAAVANALHGVKADAQVIAAGIAHNDAAYMARMMQTLHGLNARIDGFALHPYTIYDWPSPQSGRPTDAIPAVSDSWNYYHSFQGALSSLQTSMSANGYGSASIYITEFGVPSWLGYRSAGPEGRQDQARWFAEALGVLEAWGNSNLKGVVAHMVLDTELGQINDGFDAYGTDGTANDGDTERAEGAFALFERMTAGGPIVAKPVVGFLRALVADTDYDHMRIVNHVSTSSLDLSGRGSTGLGLTNGYIALTHGGNDSLIGSRHDDSLFSGAGADSISGGAGQDRIFSGNGADQLFGGNGNDQLCGGNSADRLIGGRGNDLLTGGAGADHFVFRAPSIDGDFAADRIGDFRANDVIEIDHRWGFTSAAQILARFVTVGGDKVLQIDANTSITLVGHGHKVLALDDFLLI